MPDTYADGSPRRIVAVIDERTPPICQTADGSSGTLPHDTGDPENPCRCVWSCDGPTYKDGSPLLVGDAKLLKELALKLERSETGVGRTTPTTEQCRAWHRAYTTFHLARVKLEQCDAVPCPECDGAGELERWTDSAPYPCPDCYITPGHWPCEQCGENGATTLHGKDLVCAPCATDLKQLED